MAAPASTNVNDILGAPNLTGIVWLSKSGLPDPFEEAFYATPADFEPHGDDVTVTCFTGAREVSTITAYGGASKDRQLRSIGQYQTKCITTVENIRIPIGTYANLFAYNSLTRQNKGRMELERQISEFKQYPRNLEIVSMSCALSQGQIAYDQSGQILDPATPAGTGISFVSFNIPNGTTGFANPDLQTIGTNLSNTFNSSASNGLDPFNTGTAFMGNSVVGDWANATTDIPQQITNLHQGAEQFTGRPLKRAYYGKNIASYFARNGQVAAYLTRNPQLNDKYLMTGQIPDGLFGLNWRPAYNAYFMDKNNQKVQIWQNNRIVFTPEPTPDWIGMYRGSTIIPTENAIGQMFLDGTPVENAFTEVKGMYCYGLATTDPTGCKVVLGNTFLPALRNPLVIYSCLVSAQNP